MSESNDARLAEMREQIDALDRRIVTLIAEPERCVLAAGALKKDEAGGRASAGPRRGGG
ncbi:hypothetical protein [Microbacterium soli]|uniref:Chorismate mutase n=1 Tax=Microbacterium soli TaxID=446075 RepID=A0ABP7NHJ1_9MICO